MIISVEELKTLIDCKNWTDERIARKLKAIEQTIRSYTNNPFQVRECRRAADIVGSLLVSMDEMPFKVGDTVEISESGLNAGLFTVASVSYDSITVEEDIDDETDVLITKIAYPDDVVDCAVNLMEWELNHRAKVGIKSETLSRHSVTYEDSASMFNGYPVGILSSVKLYRKARF